MHDLKLNKLLHRPNINPNFKNQTLNNSSSIILIPKNWQNKKAPLGAFFVL